MKVSFLARDRERTVLMYITDICQNDRTEKLYKKKFTRAWSRAKNETFTVTNQIKYTYIVFIINIIFFKKLKYDDFYWSQSI